MVQKFFNTIPYKARLLLSFGVAILGLSFLVQMYDLQFASTTSLVIDTQTELDLKIQHPHNFRYDPTEAVEQFIALRLLVPDHVTDTLTHTVRLDFTDKQVRLVDVQNQPVPPQVELSAHQPQSIVFLNLSPYDNDTTTHLNLELDGVPLESALEIGLQPWWMSVINQLLEAVQLPSTLLGIILSLSGVYFESIRSDEESRQQIEAQKKQHLGQIDNLIKHLQSNTVVNTVSRWLDFEASLDYSLQHDTSYQAKTETFRQQLNSYSWARDLLQAVVNDTHPTYSEQFLTLIIEEQPSKTEHLTAQLLQASRQASPNYNFMSGYTPVMVIQSCLWLYAKDDQHLPIIIPPLLKLLERCGQIDYLVTLSQVEPDILKAPKIQEKISQIADNEDCAKHHRRNARRLLDARPTYAWPADSVQPRPISRAQRNWHEKHGIPADLFGTSRAESDAQLQDNFMRQPLYDELIALAQPTLIWGDEGTGKTALARRFRYNCVHPLTNPRHPEAYPLYISPSTAELASNEAGYLELIARYASHQLIKFYALNPHAFLYDQLDRQLTLTALFDHTIGPRETTLSLLKQAGLPAEQAAQFQDFWSKHPPALIPTLSNLYWRDWLNVAHPPYRPKRFIFLDLDDLDTNPTALQLRPLLSLGEALAQQSIYLKLFLSHPPVDTPSWRGWRMQQLTWSDSDLTELIQQRVRSSGDGAFPDFLSLFGPDLVKKNPLGQLLTVSNGSPGRLIQHCNQLFDVHIQHRPTTSLLTQADLDAVLAATAEIQS